MLDFDKKLKIDRKQCLLFVGRICEDLLHGKRFEYFMKLETFLVVLFYMKGRN